MIDEWTKQLFEDWENLIAVQQISNYKDTTQLKSRK